MRRLAIAPDEIAPYIYRRPNVGDSAASLIPRAEALQSVRVLARPDGLYVYELALDSAGAFDSADLDELAYVVAMVAKSRLGHNHYHHNMPGKGRATALKPSQILYVPPVQVQPRGWATRIRDGRFGDADAMDAKAIGPGCADACAVLELRHRYIRLEEALNFRVRLHRNTQAKRLQGWVGRLSFLVYGLSAGLGMFFLVLPAMQEVGLRDAAALSLTSVLIALGLQFRARIATWDVPVVRLFRTAHGFFTSADPLNRVAEQILRSRSPSAAVDGFSTLLANLHSRIDGEQHRIGMGQNWLALSLGAASLVAAISALKHSDRLNAPPSARLETSAQLAQPAPSAKVAPPHNAAVKLAPKPPRFGQPGSDARKQTTPAAPEREPVPAAAAPPNATDHRPS